ncbi:Na+/H+ antiporter subunit E [Thiohalorhabdus sp.]|uniref:Na+/H+ antiporter subunit E n=1 Tax=Thiohalorhabdus sp. TaxID=3094134 RepID=UPI002FC37632
MHRLVGVWVAVRAFLLFFALWLVLTDGATEGLVFGVAAAAFAAALTLAGERSPWPLRPLAWLTFGPWFVAQSLLGGWDVLRRAVRPDRPLDPELLDFPTRLTTPAARRLLAATISLLPGTLVARIHEAHLRVHVLDRGLPVRAALRRLERRIGGLYGERLGP